MIAVPTMLREPALMDFLITIGLGGAWALAAFLTLREPDRNAVTRTLDRWTEMWSESAFSVAPKRAQLWIGAAVGSLIAVGALVAMVVQLVQGGLR